MADQSTSASVAAPQAQDAADGSTSENMYKAHFVKQHKAEFIQDVSTVMAIVDSLGTIVHPELYAGIQAEKTSMDQMRRLYTKVLNPGGAAINAAFYDALKQHQPDLLEKLGPELPPEDSTNKLPNVKFSPVDLQVSGTLLSRHKSKSSKKFQYLNVWINNKKKKILLDEIFTELYITEGWSGEINDEHEVRQIETASRNSARSETPIRFQEIFKPRKVELIRTVMTMGVAGIGKTVLTQKFTQDWAEGKANQNINFMFPFTFRELNSKKDNNYSLMELLCEFFAEIKNLEINIFEESQVMFILDGLDECRISLDFQNKDILDDVTKSTSLNMLLTNLIKGNLLPSACIWITTRPAAANQIPSDHVDRVTEVRGFTDPQKREYFNKSFSDKNRASQIISHIEKSRSLHIMCHIPVFCWISAKVLDDILSNVKKGELPKTLTAMYIHFMVVHSKQKQTKYGKKDQTSSDWNPKTRKAILSLGKLAFKQLEEGNLIFYEADLIKCGISIKDASVYSEVFTEIFREDCGLYEPDEKVFSFAHLSVQEFVAALYVFLKFINTGVNKMSEPQTRMSFRLLRGAPNLTDLYQSALDKALQSPNGHLDLFLRFLLGLSLDTNQSLLQKLIKHTGCRTQPNQETAMYIKRKIRQNPSPEKSINLFHCLNELNDRTLEEEIQQHLRSGSLSTVKLSPAQWSALVFVLLSSEKELDVLDLKQYSASEEALLRLLPVVKVSNRALLSGCNLSESCCEELSSTLSSSSMREVDLSDNELHDSGIKLLSVGLGSQHSRLEILRLSGCMVSEEGCAYLVSALRSNSHLNVLDFSYNRPGDLGVKLLSALPLKTLRLSGCNLSEKCCEALSSVISSMSSSLRELDLSKNDLQDLGVKQLSVGLGSPHCRLKILRLSGCNLSEKCCEALSSVISSKSSSLRELDLSLNDLQDLGVKHLSVGLGSPRCRLEILKLSGCMVSEEGCSHLDSALRSNFRLKELDLSYNHPGDLGVKLLTALPLALSVNHCGEKMLESSFMKYSCYLSLDVNTIHKYLSLSESLRKVTETLQHQGYPDHPERFTFYSQVLCRESLSKGGRYYWEVEWSGEVRIAVCYKDINKQGTESLFGDNDKSWCLNCYDEGYTFKHNKVKTKVSGPDSPRGRVGVYLDHSAGTLSFYCVTDTRTLLHTVQTTFTRPLYAGIWVGYGNALKVCNIWS